MALYQVVVVDRDTRKPINIKSIMCQARRELFPTLMWSVAARELFPSDKFIVSILRYREGGDDD
jgi:hypothetical protein